MRWQEIVESEDQWYPAEEILTIYPELNHAQNLLKSVKWMSGVSLDQCEVRFSVESIEIFRKQIDDMMESYLTYPKDKSRMKKILLDLKSGHRALPVFVQEGDSTNFIIEGHHRIVAFDQMNMTKIIVGHLRVMQG